VTAVPRRAMEAIDAWAGEPAGDWPGEFFRFLSRYLPVINVDLLILDEQGRVLLVWRDDELYGAGWHVPGGIIRYRETAAAQIRETAKRELGTEVEFEPAPAVIEEMVEHERRERGHLISMVYRCRLLGPPDPALEWREGQPRRDQWAWHEGWPADLIAAQGWYRKRF